MVIIVNELTKEEKKELYEAVRRISRIRQAKDKAPIEFIVDYNDTVRVTQKVPTRREQTITKFIRESGRFPERLRFGHSQPTN